MKKSIFAGLATIVLALFTVTPATAESYDIGDECVPQDAWTETIPAVGEPTIEVDNPDYVPATPDTPATYGTEWKYTKHGGEGFIWVDNDTYKYVKADGTRTNHKPKGKHEVYYERTQHTRQVELTPFIPGTPAVGDPTIWVPNPDYKPEQVIEHDAVTCEDPDVPDPETYFLETSHKVACGAATITLRNVSPWLYRVLVETSTDGTTWTRTADLNGAAIVPGVIEVDNRGEAPDDQTGTYTVTFGEDTGDHLVRYRVSSGTESDLYKGKPVGEWTVFTVTTDCVAPEDPETADPEPTQPPAQPAPPAAPAATPAPASPTFTG